ncbi:MAG: MBL fold metallo-hydrolase [Clostridia bacterium]|nr:MBL fold metallo-hydrolase [Clostridia bacterium]
MKVTWFGTASLAVETAAGRLLIDPFFPLKGSPTRVAPDAYAGYEDILVTHGHFDHIMSLPGIMREGRGVIHCTDTPRRTLMALDVPAERVIPFKAGDVLALQGMNVQVFQTRHVVIDRALLRRTLLNPRMLQYAGNVATVLFGLRNYPENGEIVGFLIEGDGRSLYVLGSLGLDDGTDYPTGMDLLVLPYQGASDLLTPGMKIVDHLKPKAVLLDHFDDSFPPGTGPVDVSDIRQALEGRLPLHILRPGESVTV